MSCFGFVVAVGLVLAVSPATAATFSFSTGNSDGRIATAATPGTETADDFVLGSTTTLTSASFTGLLTGGARLGNVGQVSAEIYRVFPLDSDVSRTSGSPTFSTPDVPTRVNSPSDVVFDSRSSGSGLNFIAQDLGAFTAANSVVLGINPSPGSFTGGEGSVGGEETTFTVNFTTPFVLGAGHYFFVPQVAVTGGQFLWLSAPDPIVAPGTTLSPDLQAWIRDSDLDPDWLRIGTDITHQGPFNMVFSLAGTSTDGGAVPEPASWGLMLLGFVGLGARLRSRRRALTV